MFPSLRRFVLDKGVLFELGATGSCAAASNFLSWFTWRFGGNWTQIVKKILHYRRVPRDTKRPLCRLANFSQRCYL